MKKKKKIAKGKFYSLSRKIHWISSAVCFAGIVFFTITGITLNHASLFEAAPSHDSTSYDISDNELTQLKKANGRIESALALTHKYTGLSAPKSIEDNGDEFFLDFPFPGGYRTVTLDLIDKVVLVEYASNGFISIINDLHKGRHANLIWIIFIDVCSILILLFCFSGLILLYQHAPKRGSTWPLTGLGILLPFLLALTMYIT